MLYKDQLARDFTGEELLELLKDLEARDMLWSFELRESVYGEVKVTWSVTETAEEIKEREAAEAKAQLAALELKVKNAQQGLSSATAALERYKRGELPF